MRKTLAGLVFVLSSLLGISDSYAQDTGSSTRAAIVASKPAKKTIYDLPGVVRKSIRVSEVPEIKLFNLSLPFPWLDIGGISFNKIFTDKDYQEAIDKLSSEGTNFYFDKKNKKVFVAEEDERKKEDIKNCLDGKILYIAPIGDKRIYVLEDIARKERIETMVSLDISNDGKTGLLDRKVLFKTDGGEIIYGPREEILGFNGKGNILFMKDGKYFFYDTNESKGEKIWDVNGERSEFYISPSGKFCVSRRKVNSARYIDVYSSDLGKRYYELEFGKIKRVDDDGVVYVKGERASWEIKFSEMKSY